MKAIYLSGLSLACMFVATVVRAEEPAAPKPKGPSPVTIEVGKIVLEADPIEPPAPKTPVTELPKPIIESVPDNVPGESKTAPASDPPADEKVEPPAQKKPAPPSDPPERLLPPFQSQSPATPPPGEANGPAYTLLTEQPDGIVGPPIDPGRRWFIRSELLLWWQNPQSAPALVTTDIPPGTGFLNSPTRTILYGNGTVGDPFRQGLRISWGWWGDDLQSCGVDGSFFFIGQDTDRFFADSRQFPILVRPFFAANAGIVGENGQFVAYPPGFGRPDYTGSVTVLSNSRLWGADLNIKELLCSGSGMRFGYRFDVFAGYRYLSLDEDLTIREDVTVGAGNPAGLPPGTRALVQDEFSTVNQFHGPQVGATFEARRGLFFLEARLALAMGVAVQNLNINGFQLVTQPGQATQLFAGGLLALPAANIGKYNNAEFSVAPEVRLRWGYQVLPRTRVFMGYNFFYWSNVIRPGSEIDRVIDVSKVPNFAPPGAFPPVVPPRPRPQFNQTGIWAQGLDFGLEYRY